VQPTVGGDGGGGEKAGGRMGEEKARWVAHSD
jgi:hypothetical protein